MGDVALDGAGRHRYLEEMRTGNLGEKLVNQLVEHSGYFSEIETNILINAAKKKFMDPDIYKKGVAPLWCGIPLVPMSQAPSPSFEFAKHSDPRLALAAELFETWPEQVVQAQRLMSFLCPIIDTSHPDDEAHQMVGGTCGGTNEPLGIYSTLNDPIFFVEGIAHELAHWKLHILGVHLENWDSLVGNRVDEFYTSPVRKDKPRPMGAVLHAQYSYVHVTEMGNRVFNHAKLPRYRHREMLELNLSRISEGFVTLTENFRPADEFGQKWFTLFQTWTAEVMKTAQNLLAS